VDDKDSLKLVQIVNDPKFRELDLIFGPLYASGLKSVAKKPKSFAFPLYRHYSAKIKYYSITFTSPKQTLRNLPCLKAWPIIV